MQLSCLKHLFKTDMGARSQVHVTGLRNEQAPRRHHGCMELEETLAQLRAALNEAMHDRDQPAVMALRAAISALQNAAAVPADDRGGSIEESPSGAGATDVPRHELTPHEVQFIIETEVDLREAEAASCERLGQHERAERLRAEADALAPWTT